MKIFKTNHENSALKTVGWIVLLIQAGASLFALYTFNKTNIFITRYFMVVCGVLLVLFLLTSVWVVKTKGFSARIVSVLLSCAILFGSFYAFKTDQLLKTITGGKTDTHFIHVVVKKESSAQTISDVVHDPIGGNTSLDLASINKAKSLIEAAEDVDLQIQDYDGYDTLINDLFDGNIKAMIIGRSEITWG
ncbi:hypothetical protein AOC36_02570 [Erysipelothrix larvae]|uniref:Uncharacterized protein n=1 Tax=Erysipelothrix larvae TaxID=1514105 RepID=A0A0X8GYS0_9FIRM|nr:hypothetical protein [Erysipelothrix larvae]AMC92906.1 hypothetical protein AOC36_02570 [Erysipelothrix larvae]